LDSSTKKPLIFATISVLKVSDTALLTYRLTDLQGQFRVPDLPINIPVYMVISFSGYAIYRKEFMLQANVPLDLGAITMNPSPKNLDEILVVGERPPVRVYKHTIEFNAASFKTLPTALVEDLLKKLPGVEVDCDGNILVIGRDCLVTVTEAMAPVSEMNWEA